MHPDSAHKTPSLAWIISRDRPRRFYSELLKMVRWVHLSRIPIEIARWLVTLLLMCLALDLMNQFLPNRDRPWRWITPGRLFVAIMFVLASFGFNVYLRYFANYPRVYGALAGFIVLMMWIYIASLILLVGAEIDNNLERLERGASA